MSFLRTKNELQLSPAFYFADEAYSQYRELLCVERPACFVLHYYCGITWTRALLYDRMLFSFDPNDACIKPCSNEMSLFLESQDVIKTHVAHFEGGISQFLKLHLASDAALVLPKKTFIGAEKLVTGVLVEGFSDSAVLVTSLRGDDFYIRKNTPISDVTMWLDVEGDKIIYHTVRLSPEIDNLTSKSLKNVLEEYNILGRFYETLLALEELQAPRVSKRANGDSVLSSVVTLPENSENFVALEPCIYGSVALRAFLEAKKAVGFSFYHERINDGFSNVLLAKVLWPMTFSFSTFLVFLSYLDSSNVWFESYGARLSFISASLNQLKKQSETVTNLGMLFGKRPHEVGFMRFFSALSELVDCYTALEKSLIAEAIAAKRAKE